MSQEFAALLHQFRVQNRISQADLATKAGISRRTLIYWESGEKLPRITELESVLSALEITAHEKIHLYMLMPVPRSHQHIKTQEKRLSPTGQGTMVHWGDLLRAMRVRKGKPQEQFAAEVGVARMTLIRWETQHTFPTEDNLERMCTLLEANSEERLALISHSLTHSDGSGTSDIETCRAQLDEVIRRIGHQSPLSDLSVLALQRRLSLLAMSEPEALYLLARTQLTVAHTHNLKSHDSAAKQAAKKALALFAKAGRADENWALALNLVSNYTGKGKADYLAKVKFLHQNLLPTARPDMKLRMYCDMALYLSLAGKWEESAVMISHARKELRAAQDTQGNHHYFALSYGRVLLNRGVPEAAMQQFTDITRCDPQNPRYLCYLAEAALAMGERGAGANFLQQATDMVAQSPFKQMQEQVHRMTQRL